jgi:hypothetical protein
MKSNTRNQVLLVLLLKSLNTSIKDFVILVRLRLAPCFFICKALLLVILIILVADKLYYLHHPYHPCHPYVVIPVVLAGVQAK